MPNENLPSNIQMDASENGSVIFATDVIATIAGLAATEVEGVASMVSGQGGFADIFTRKGQNSKSMTKGVKIDLGENNRVSVSLTIIAEYGSPIPEVAGNIQENVKKAIETMSGLTVSSVNVHVSALSFEKEQRAAAEIEQKQRLMLQKDASPKEDEPAAKEETPEQETAPAKDEEPAPAAQASGAAETPAQTPEEDDGAYELELEDVPEEDETPAEADSESPEGNQQ